MANDAKKGAPEAKTDLDRAKLRGKGHEPDYAPGTREGMTFIGELGQRGGDKSMHGYDAPGSEPPEERYHPPAKNPSEQG